ncbi:MAG: hypothetical protein ACE366_16485 [Bradymonadia bacterium]
MAQRYGIHPVAYAHSRTPGQFFRDVQGWMSTFTVPMSMIFPRGGGGDGGGGGNGGGGGSTIPPAGQGPSTVKDASTGRQVRISAGMAAVLRRQGVSKIYHIDSAARSDRSWAILSRAGNKAMS